MSHDDLNEVITKSVNDFNLWVIIEALEDTSEYKLYFIEEGVNWCSISGVGTVSNDKIKECYEKAMILETLYSIIHITYEELNQMIPDEMLDKNFRIKDKCKIICKLDFMVLSTNESNPKTIFYCENKLSIDMESSLRNALSEFGNYEIISIRESIGIDGISCAEFKTNLPYDFYRFVLSAS